MCNFVIRPIKSYATIDLLSPTQADADEPLIKRGEYIDVKYIRDGGVAGNINGDEDKPVWIKLETFIHAFTANPNDTEKVHKEENKIMGYNSRI